jgi:hypothetical protein
MRSAHEKPRRIALAGLSLRLRGGSVFFVPRIVFHTAQAPLRHCLARSGMPVKMPSIGDFWCVSVFPTAALASVKVDIIRVEIHRIILSAVCGVIEQTP